MNEGQWLASDDPTPMLEHLGDALLQRKRVLFAVACCRRLWQHFNRTPAPEMIELAERFADGRVGEEDLRKALMAANPPPPPKGGPDYRYWELDERTRRATGVLAVVGLLAAAVPRASLSAKRRQQDLLTGLWEVQNRIGRKADQPRTFLSFEHARQKEQVKEAALLRCIVGNPFRPPPAVPPSSLAWNGGSVEKLAQAIYDERRFGDLPILADALEDAGCDNPDMLSHCRRGGEHARGCWVVDAVRQKG